MFGKFCGGEHGTGKCNCAQYASIPLRLALGIVFINHGWDKLTEGGGASIGQFSSFLGEAGLNLPANYALAWLVALVEFVGGIAVLLGVFTSIAATLIAIDMLFAIILTYGKKPFAPGTEFEIALLAIALSLAARGAGMWSIDSKLMEKKNTGSAGGMGGS
jgi:putative oxidoreductase